MNDSNRQRVLLRWIVTQVFKGLLGMCKKDTKSGSEGGLGPLRDGAVG